MKAKWMAWAVAITAGMGSLAVGAAPTGTLKIGWMPPGSYNQMQYTPSGTIGSTIRLTVDITYPTNEGPYNITPKDLTFSETAGHPGQSATFAAASLTITTLTDYPSPGQTTKRYQGIGHPTQWHHHGTWTAHAVAAWGWGRPMPPPPQQGTIPLTDVTVTTRNLSVQDARNGHTGGPTEYCLFDPDNASLNTIQVQYTLDDMAWGDARDTTNMTVYIYRSDQSQITTITETRTSPEAYTTTPWDGKNGMGQQIASKGIYFFKVVADQPAGSHHTYADHHQDKSCYLTVSNALAGVSQYLSPARNFQVKLPYTLSDTGGSAAYDCKVEALNNDFSQIYSNAGLPTDLGSQTVCFPLLMATGGYYRLIIGATDSHNTADKVHLRKLALQNAPTIYMPIAENYNNTFATTPASSNASAYQDPLPDPRSYYSRVYHDLPNINAVMAAKKRIADDSIIFIDNHGSPGWIQLAGGNDYYAVGWSGSKQDGTTARIDDADWSKVRFVCFVGCETALSDPLYGNLLDASVDAGAQLAMGFTGIITRHRDSDPPLGSYPDIWSNAFWQYACGWSSAAPYPQYSPTPYGAANYAADAILSQFGKTGGFDTYQFRGYYGCLVPAFQFNP